MEKKELLSLLRDDNFMENNKTFALVVQLPGHPVNELLVNQNINAKVKADYIDKTYNENLEHKFSPGVKIVGVNFYYKPINQLL